MRSTNNRRGEQWRECDRCGFDYPLSMLTVQDGLTVCTATCVYEKGAEYYRRFVEVPMEREPIELEGDEESD